MTKKTSLKDFNGSSFDRGVVFRFRAKYPYEESIDFMLCETQIEERPYGLIVTSGYKAGLIVVNLPLECCSMAGGIRKEWIIDNWRLWIYPDCDVSDVCVIEGYISDS